MSRWVRNALSTRHTVHKLHARGHGTICGLETSRPGQGIWNFTSGASRPLCRKCFRREFL